MLCQGYGPEVHGPCVVLTVVHTGGDLLWCSLHESRIHLKGEDWLYLEAGLHKVGNSSRQSYLHIALSHMSSG